jgi:sporulation protein YlmC with PRC-barrel domain
MNSNVLIAGLISCMMAVPALAQTDRPASPPARTDTTTTAPRAQATMWRASKLMGLDVYNEQNEKLGDVEEILLDKSGKVAGVVIGVGGFLGIGERNVKVDMSKLKFMDEPARTAGTRTTTTTGTGDRPATQTTTARNGDRKWYPDHAVLMGAGNKDQVKNMPEFKYD